MTLTEYILKLRRRLQDLRLADKTVITTISQDGVRWSSAELLEIANAAIIKVVRLMQTYPKSDFMQRVADVKPMAYGSGSTNASGVKTLANNEFVVLAVQDTEGAYGLIPSHLYEQYKLETAEPRSGEKYFAQFYDVATGKQIIRILPQAAISITYSYVYIKNDYVVGNASDTIFLFGVDDLLLDAGEMEARDREHNWERSAILDKRIMFALGVQTNA